MMDKQKGKENDMEGEQTDRHDRRPRTISEGTQQSHKDIVEGQGCCRNQEDSKLLFSYAISKFRIEEQIGPLRDIAGNLIDEPKLMAMLLNEFFSSVFTTEDQTNIPRLHCEVDSMDDITLQVA